MYLNNGTPCKFCGRRFLQIINLQYHEKKHEKEHRQLVEAKEKPFKCPETGCDRRFRLASVLRSHEVGHAIKRQEEMEQAAKGNASPDIWDVTNMRNELGNVETPQAYQLNGLAGALPDMPVLPPSTP